MIADGSASAQPDSVRLFALIGAWFDAFATRPIDGLPLRNILPLTGFTIAHSLRIAYLYHSVLSAQGVKVGRRRQDVSFLQSGLVCTTLVMSGTTMAALLQGQPSGLLSEGSGEMVAAYMLASFAMKWLHPILAQLPQLPLKVLCFFIDGFATTFGTLSLGLVPTLNDPRRQSSAGEPLLLPLLLIPLLCGSGASLLVPVFGLFQPRFAFGHPGFLSTHLPVDIWGPWMISLCYGTLVDGRGLLFGGCRRLLRDGTLAGIGSMTSKEGARPAAWMRADEAHVLCSLILSATYIANEFGPQLLNRLTVPGPGGGLSKKEEAEQERENGHAIHASGIEGSRGAGTAAKRKEKQ